MSRAWPLATGLLLLTFVYIGLGGFFFRKLEATPEIEAKQRYQERMHNISESFKCLTQADIRLIVAQLQDLPPQLPDWNWWNSLHFASLVVFSVGFGHHIVRKDSTVWFSTFYAFIGVPLAFSTVFSLGYLLFRGLTVGDRKSWRPERYLLGRVMLRSGALVCFFVILFILVPAAIVCVFEQWTYGRSLHWTVLTGLTVGYGHNRPGRRASSSATQGLFRLCVSGWLFVGLVALACAVLHVVYSTRMWLRVRRDDDPNDARSIPRIEITAPPPTPSDVMSSKRPSFSGIVNPRNQRLWQSYDAVDTSGVDHVELETPPRRRQRSSLGSGDTIVLPRGPHVFSVSRNVTDGQSPVAHSIYATAPRTADSRRVSNTPEVSVHHSDVTFRRSRTEGSITEIPHQQRNGLITTENGVTRVQVVH